MRSLTNEMSPLALQVFMDVVVKAGDDKGPTTDLSSRSIHQLLLHKKAQIPRAAMPWAKRSRYTSALRLATPLRMKMLQKTKSKGGVLPKAPNGGAPDLSPKSIKSVSQMVGGNLVRTKFK